MKKENMTLILTRLHVIKDSLTENKLFKSGILLQHLICKLESDIDEDHEEDFEDEDENDDDEDKPPYDYFYQMELVRNKELREMLIDRNQKIDKLTNHIKLLIKRDHIFNLDETVDLLESLYLGDRDSLLGSRGKV